jgi:hypothetical protein
MRRGVTCPPLNAAHQLIVHPQGWVTWMTTSGGAWLLVLTLTGLTHAVAAQRATPTTLRSVDVASDGSAAVVTIDVDGTFPLPTAHWLDAPPRVYLDLAGVTPGTRGTTHVPGAGIVTRVRIALRSADPDVTRIVLDLARREGVRVTKDEQQAGRIRVFVGPESTLTPHPPPPLGVATTNPAAPPSPALGEATTAPVAPTDVAQPPLPPSLPPATAELPPPDGQGGGAPAAGVAAVAVHEAAATSPAVPPPVPARTRPPSMQAAAGPRLPARDVERYHRQLSGALERIAARRPVVAAIDADENVDEETLGLAATELTDLRRFLITVTPSAVMMPTHDLLIASCTLGATAASLRLEAARTGSVEARRNAASAAAGSLMLFDRAWASLGRTALSR